MSYIMSKNAFFILKNTIFLLFNSMTLNSNSKPRHLIKPKNGLKTSIKKLEHSALSRKLQSKNKDQANSVSVKPLRISTIPVQWSRWEPWRIGVMRKAPMGLQCLRRAESPLTKRDLGNHHQKDFWSQQKRQNRWDSSENLG